MSYEQDYLLMLTDDQIDYKSLSEQVLKRLALDVEPYIAQSALTELQIRESNEAVPTACQLLSSAQADRYLQATAIEILFQMDRDKGLDYMIEYAPTCDPYVLNEMMNLILYDSDFRYELTAARLIAQRLQQIEQEKKEVGATQALALEPDVLEEFQRVLNPADSYSSNHLKKNPRPESPLQLAH